MSNSVNDFGVDGGREMPSVNAAKPKATGSRKSLALFLIVVLAVGCGAVYWTITRLKDNLKGSTAPKVVEEQDSTHKRKFGDFFPKAIVPAALAAPAPAVPIKPPPLGITPSAPPPQGGNFTQQAGHKPPSPYDSAMIVNGNVQPGMGQSGLGSSASGLMPVAMDSSTGSDVALLGGNNNATGGALSGLLTATSTPTVRAGQMGNLSLTAPKGESVDCVLHTRIIAMVPGMIKCSLTNPLYSADGKVVLAERNSVVTGEQSGQMKQGQTRLYVLWNRIRTPKGVIINIDSPGTDALGGSGVDGYVDRHWGERIGAALLLSVVQDVFAYEIAKASEGGGNNIAQNTSQSGQKMAEKVLESTINIPPTLYRNQGDRISIFVARDLDFSSVYELQPSNSYDRS